jgi:hypothetical protein
MDDLGFVARQAVTLKAGAPGVVKRMRSSRKSRSSHRRDPQLVREEVLRPCPFLGYDRDQLGVHLLGRDALELAESQFRRAVWLNPYEPWFKLHWATALLALKRLDEAKRLLIELMADGPCIQAAHTLWRRHWPAEAPPGCGAPHSDASDA